MVVKEGNPAGLGVCSRLLSSNCQGVRAQLRFQVFDGAVAVAQAGVEFAFAKVRTWERSSKALFVEFCEACAVALFEQRAALAFFERLHPQRFGHVGDGFRQAVQGGGPGVESGGEGLPPGIEQRINGVGGAAA